MSDSASFEELIERLRAGNDEAAQQVVEEYTNGLLAVARRQISARLSRRVDPEDVVQSAYRSLFLRVQKGQFDLGNGADLWKLLVTITINKVRKQANFHTAARRDMNLEQSDQRDDDDGPAQEEQMVSSEPSPAEAALFVDEVTSFLATVNESERPIVELRLQGLSSAEIAAEVGRAERSVRRVLERVVRRLEQSARQE